MDPAIAASTESVAVLIHPIVADASPLKSRDTSRTGPRRAYAADCDLITRAVMAAPFPPNPMPGCSRCSGHARRCLPCRSQFRRMFRPGPEFRRSGSPGAHERAARSSSVSQAANSVGVPLAMLGAEGGFRRKRSGHTGALHVSRSRRLRNLRIYQQLSWISTWTTPWSKGKRPLRARKSGLGSNSLPRPGSRTETVESYGRAW